MHDQQFKLMLNLYFLTFLMALVCPIAIGKVQKYNCRYHKYSRAIMTLTSI